MKESCHQSQEPGWSSVSQRLAESWHKERIQSFYQKGAAAVRLLDVKTYRGEMP